MPKTMTFTGQLTIVTCWCGMAYAEPSDPRRHAIKERDAGRDFSTYCPLGHAGVPAGKSDAQRERERTEAAERRAEQAEATARRQRLRAEKAERSAIAYRGHLTRIKNRIANGVCPVPGCKRTGLVQTMRHIASKHPHWHAEHAQELA